MYENICITIPFNDFDNKWSIFNCDFIPGIKNGFYKRNIKTKYGEIKDLSVPRNRYNKFHSAIIDNNKSIGIDELITSMYSNGISIRKISNILKDIFNIV